MSAYYLSATKILNSPNVGRIAKEAMRRAMAQAYLLPGHWLRDLPTLDLEYLGKVFAQATEEEARGEVGPAGEEVVLLTLILSTAEGCAPQDSNEVAAYSGLLSAMITYELLGRRGLVKVFHDKLSFLAGDEVVVQRL